VKIDMGINSMVKEVQRRSSYANQSEVPLEEDDIALHVKPAPKRSSGKITPPPPGAVGLFDADGTLVKGPTYLREGHVGTNSIRAVKGASDMLALFNSEGRTAWLCSRSRNRSNLQIGGAGDADTKLKEAGLDNEIPKHRRKTTDRRIYDRERSKSGMYIDTLKQALPKGGKAYVFEDDKYEIEWLRDELKKYPQFDVTFVGIGGDYNKNSRNHRAYAKSLREQADVFGYNHEEIMRRFDLLESSAVPE